MRLQRHNIITRLPYLLVISVLGFTNGSIGVHAQDLEPRAYTNTPVGMNFVLAGYQYSSGGLYFDPSLPVTDAYVKINMGQLAYVRSLDIAGKSAKAGVLLRYAGLSGDGYLDGNYQTREQNGLADPAFYFTINLYGAPALSFKEFKDYKQDTIIGFTLKFTAPLGVYDSDKAVNIGTNRWAFKPEFGVSKAIGRWTLEGSAAAILYTDNDNFFNGQTVKQDPIYTVQGHVIYSFKNHVWAAVSATYYNGGRTTIDGMATDTLQQNWRTGFTLAIPVNLRNSIKLYGNTGVSTRTGTDYDSLGITWQYRWGGGI